MIGSFNGTCQSSKGHGTQSSNSDLKLMIFRRPHKLGTKTPVSTIKVYMQAWGKILLDRISGWTDEGISESDAGDWYLNPYLFKTSLTCLQ